MPQHPRLSSQRRALGRLYMNTFLQHFTTIHDIERAYACQVPGNAEILLAWYGSGDYAGSSCVLYRLGRTLYEVNGSHCSCNGVEGQWEPEETTTTALKMRTFSGGYEGADEARETLTTVMQRLEEEEK
jgi:hypothetical protein